MTWGCPMSSRHIWTWAWWEYTKIDDLFFWVCVFYSVSWVEAWTTDHYVLQIVHTHHGPHGYTSLVKITFHLSLSSAEPELLLSHDHSHAWRGSRRATMLTHRARVRDTKKPSIRFASSDGFFVPCSSVIVLVFNFCFDLRTWTKCFPWHTKECRPWQTVTTFGSSRLTYDARAYRDIRPLVIPFLFAPPDDSDAKPAARMLIIGAL